RTGGRRQTRRSRLSSLRCAAQIVSFSAPDCSFYTPGHTKFIYVLILFHKTVEIKGFDPCSRMQLCAWLLLCVRGVHPPGLGFLVDAKRATSPYPPLTTGRQLNSRNELKSISKKRKNELPDLARYLAYSPAQFRRGRSISSLSTTMVTGPSFTSSTAIFARKRPVCT